MRIILSLPSCYGFFFNLRLTKKNVLKFPNRCCASFPGASWRAIYFRTFPKCRAARAVPVLLRRPPRVSSCRVGETCCVDVLYLHRFFYFFVLSYQERCVKISPSDGGFIFSSLCFYVFLFFEVTILGL